jgi:cellulose synthase/poly-beta-1,6-N-acetylglucosamine synthase-like glycosyltransferase
MPGLEVIVVDDDSTDRTRAVAQAAGVQVVVSRPRPSGWMGKTWAAWQAAEVARGNWLLFVDADVELAPATVRAAVALAEKENIALLTALSQIECASLWEAFLYPAGGLMILTAVHPKRVNNPADPHAHASGAFMLFRRTAYETIGGHLAVRDQVMDDTQLAVAIKSRGLAIRVVNAAHLIRIRREQTFIEICHQAYRVFDGAFAGRSGTALVSAALVWLSFSGPHTAALLGLLFYGLTPRVWVLIVLAFVQTCASAAAGWMLWRSLRMDNRFVVFQPISALFGVGALLHAALFPLGRGGRVRWRGRRLGAADRSSAPP